MNRSQLLILVLAVLTACESDKVIVVDRVISPDRRAAAVYRKYLYGGAAGGVGHCVSVSSPAEIDEADCLLLASRISDLKLLWSGNVLFVHYSDASITQFRNEAYISTDTLDTSKYEIRLVHEPT